MKNVLVVGLGRFGRAVAEALAQAGQEVIAVDVVMGPVEAVRDHVAVAAQIEHLTPETLRALGATELDAAVVAIGEDFAACVLSVAVLREMGVRRIVARADSPRTARILELVGATQVIEVEADMGRRVARMVLEPGVLDHVPLGDGAAVIRWTADERAAGRAVEALALRARWQINVIGIRPAGSPALELAPAPDHVVRAGDVLLLAGPEERLAEFVR
jgi:trk system potassium uptake protein TrkA